MIVFTEVLPYFIVTCLSVVNVSQTLTIIFRDIVFPKIPNV